MSEVLGALTWWSVANVGYLDRDQVGRALEQHAVRASIPRYVSAADTFRRLSSNAKHSYVHDGLVATLALHKTQSQRTMLTRDIVRSLSTPDGVAVSHEKVGDAAFYKPPRGRGSKARMRVAVLDRSDEHLEEFAAQLRAEYAESVGAMDAPAVRKIVRTHLAAVNALYVGGPYVAPSSDCLDPLLGLFDELGEGSSITVVPLVNDRRCVALLGRAIEDAVRAGAGLDLVEAYVPSGVVPETVWALLEETPRDRHDQPHQPA